MSVCCCVGRGQQSKAGAKKGKMRIDKERRVDEREEMKREKGGESD